MEGEHKTDWPTWPGVAAATLATEARQAFEGLLQFCAQDDGPFRSFETNLRQRLFALGCVLVRLFLTVRHERLAWQDPTPPPGYRLGNPRAERTLKTLVGAVTSQRAQMLRTQGGPGYHPLDVALGLTRDGFSPWVIQFVTRLATRMSFAASRLLCRSVLGWSPSTEAIEQLVLGLGRQAQPFMQQQAAPATDGEVLVIEVDGKCPPTARAEELRKRRGPRGAAREGLCVRLPTASRAGPAPAAGQQETPEERGSQQERQGSGAGGDVHAAAG